MSVSDLAAVRWNKETDASAHKPIEALQAALRDIDAEASHVIVLIAKADERGGADLSWYQAGSYNLHGQLGMLSRAERAISDGAYSE